MSEAERTIEDPLHGQTVTFVTRARESGGELLAAEVRVAPGGTVPRHLHLRQNERVELLEGKLMVRVGSEENFLTAGQSIDVPRRCAHLVRNEGSTEARFRLEVRPARRMESAMRTLFFVMRRAAALRRRGT